MLSKIPQIMSHKIASSSLNIVVIGGSRGIGLGFVKEYLSENHKVFATYRDNGRGEGLMAMQENYRNSLKLIELDVTNFDAVDVLHEKIDVPIDILILNAGIILCPPGSGPLTESVEDLRRTFEVNTFAPDRIMRSLSPRLLNPDSCAVYISSTLASTSQNLKGRYHPYRASKTAGNILFQNWNIQLAKEWLEQEGAVDERPTAFPISPGVVQTDMGGPNSPLTITESVTGMIKVISEVREHKLSAFYLYDGSVLDQFPMPEVVSTKLAQEALGSNNFTF